MLKIDDIYVNYGNSEALRGISLELNKGEMIALLGGNGAGKTTTINTVSGLTKLVKGKVYFEGEDISQVPPHLRVKRGIIQVPEGRKLFPFLSVYDNMLVGSYPCEPWKQTWKGRHPASCSRSRFIYKWKGRRDRADEIQSNKHDRRRHGRFHKGCYKRILQRLRGCVAYGAYGTHGAYGAYGEHGAYGAHGAYGSYGSHGPHGPHGTHGYRTDCICSIRDVKQCNKTQQTHEDFA